MLLCAFVPTVQQAQASTDEHAVVINLTLSVPCVPSDDDIYRMQKYVAKNEGPVLVDARRDSIVLCIGTRDCNGLRGICENKGDIDSSILSCSSSDVPSVSLQVPEESFNQYQFDLNRKVFLNPFRPDLEGKWSSCIGEFTRDEYIIHVQLMGLAHENIFRGVVARSNEPLKYVFDALYDHSKSEQSCQELKNYYSPRLEESELI
jgi:hypothetical protein